MRTILALFLFASQLHAQTAEDVRFELTTANGRTTFRIGEAIDLEFRFTSQAAGRYEVDPCYLNRRFVGGSRDAFVVEPKIGTVDPLADLPAQIEGGVSCLMGVPVVLGSTPLVRSRFLNDWVEFRQPGRFRVSAATNQIVDLQSRVPVRLQSNTLEIEIIVPEPGWTKKQAEQATDVLKAGGSSSDPALMEAAKALRFLESAEAIPSLVEFFDKYRFTRDLELGLFSSPFRKEILARLEADLKAPDIPITKSWLDTLVELATVAITGPRPKPPAAQTEEERLRWKAAEDAYVAQFKPVQNRYLLELSSGVTQKQGQARAVTLQTLLIAGPQPPDESVRRAVIDRFTELPDGNQISLLNSYWLQWASADAHPAVLAAAKGHGAARNDALIRLMEFSKEEARQVVIDRVRQGDYAVVYGTFPRALLMLPDKTLSQLDDELASAYEQELPVDRLVARYATERIYDRILAAYAKRPVCGEILAYFFRIDPDRAPAIRNAASHDGQPCILQLDWPVTRSPGLEQAAIEDLRSGNPQLLEAALPLLERGSARAKEALWNEMERRKQNGTVVPAIIDALLKPGEWLLTAEELDEMKAACPNSSCRSSVEDARRVLKSPVPVRCDGVFRIGLSELSSPEAIVSLLKQYPAGTEFRLQELLPRARPWNYPQRLLELRAAFSAAGIELLEN